jgi:hypothetical protein
MSLRGFVPDPHRKRRSIRLPTLAGDADCGTASQLARRESQSPGETRPKPCTPCVPPRCNRDAPAAANCTSTTPCSRLASLDPRVGVMLYRGASWSTNALLTRGNTAERRSYCLRERVSVKCKSCRRRGADRRAAPALETAIDLYNELGDVRHKATAMVPLGVIQAVSDPNGG